MTTQTTGQQLPHSTASATVPQSVLSLPHVVRTQHGKVLRPQHDPRAFIENELDVSILDGLERWLWLAGRVDNIRPLHHQRLLRREIVLTERSKAHLLWTENRIFLKPLPAWLLDTNFVQDNVPKDAPCLKQAKGFLRSYLLLLQYESDFMLAKELHLIPEELAWKNWLDIVEKHAHLLLEGRHARSPRYHYGELRLYRVNLLYRFLPPFHADRFFRGYLYGHANYKGFIQRNFAWLLVAFLYITIVLTAMQLGLATPQLTNDKSFERASYGFAVFSIILPLAAIVYMIVLSVIMVIYNVTTTLLHVRSINMAQQTPSSDRPSTTSA
ncbi:uncharacterized protein AB675_3779 [Cyphellophora attinorum]|uniref:Subtilisin-like serine protease n=1 Tax=Cyphellophora attinorum TaxID=1664694 RepID=A0A0N0NHY9_9EURO|nr:uncharacterized protein AB675_3779 [Phialophora attinorum]KPI35231.1 hypothetical protein AB675_3779 [Phialophora attinorum]